MSALLPHRHGHCVQPTIPLYIRETTILQITVCFQPTVRFPDFNYIIINMGKIKNYIKTHKEIVVIIIIAALLVANQFIKENPNGSVSTPSVTPVELKPVSYKSITPGTSSESQLNKDLGTPINKKEDNGQTILEFKSTNQYRNNEAIVENGKVVFIKEIVNFEDNKKSDSITKVNGQAPYTLYESKPNSSFNLYVYPNKGLAYLGHPDGTLLEVWYFVPVSTIQDFVSKWGKDYSFNKPSNINTY